MQAQDITELQERFGVKLPDDWILLVTDYPEELKMLTRHDGRTVMEAELSNDAEVLRELNEEVRFAPVWTGDWEEVAWPSHCFVIGENSDNDYYYIDTTAEHPGVWFFDHFLCAFVDLEEDVIGFAESLIEMYATEEQLKMLDNREEIEGDNETT